MLLPVFLSFFLSFFLYTEMVYEKKKRKIFLTQDGSFFLSFFLSCQGLSGIAIWFAIWLLFSKVSSILTYLSSAPTAAPESESESRYANWDFTLVQPLDV